MTRVKSLIWIFLLSPIFVGVVVLFSPVICFLMFKDWIERRKFYMANPANLFFVCTSRHQWEPFILNNVLPALPPKVQTHWVPDRQHKKRSIIDRLCPNGITKPYLVHFHKRGYEMVSLHEEFLGLKQHAQTDREIQQQVRFYLLSAVEQIESQMQSNRLPADRRMTT